jgi:foldase protein PrsA
MLIAVLTLSMALVTGCNKKETTEKSDNDLDKVIVTVDDTEIKLSDAMYFIFDAEAMGEYYDQMYLAYTGSGYWDATDDEGVTNRQKAKDYVMDNVVMIDILSKKAEKEKLTLTDDDKSTNKENVKTILEQVTDEQLKITGFTEKTLLATLNKMTLAGKYYNQMVEGFDIDEEALKADINKDDYRQYNTDYILFATSTTDESGNAVALSDKEKKAALKNAQEALTSLKAGKTFDELKETYADAATTDSLNFINTDEIDSAYKTAALKLENEQLSEVVEGAEGYYVIQMTDNNSTESYDAAVEEAVNTATAEKFDEAYEVIKKDYKITVNEKVWDTIEMGETTIVEDTTATDDAAATGTTDDAATDGTTGTTDDAATDGTTTDSGTSDDAATDGANE